MLTMNDNRRIPTRDDLFGPAPGWAADRRTPVHAGLRRALARLLVSLGTRGWQASETFDGLIAALRAEIDAAGAGLRQQAAVHPDTSVSVAELALLVESLATARTEDRPAWARRLFSRYGRLAAEELVVLAEAEDALQPLLATVMTAADMRAVTARMMAMVPPARVQAVLALALPPMDDDERTALLAAAAAAIDGTGMIGLAPEAWSRLRRQVALAA
ncbi:hypothetical protein GWK16_16215 [Roseomonas sp. JC162]|uniref:Uncharacterized protein n=1 Tax=Neoroseomonas marina TaxID=1232220 RepID=A0A848EH87_9PROT|nr:hypothetical protein [Neoroseomonas marina]NMJ42793.1 hypothetical protein [Neoroseomonas marina]